MEIERLTEKIEELKKLRDDLASTEKKIAESETILEAAHLHKTTIIQKINDILAKKEETPKEIKISMNIPEDLAKMVDDGLTTGQIAEKKNVPRCMVIDWLKYAGLHIKPGRRSKACKEEKAQTPSKSSDNRAEDE